MTTARVPASSANVGPGFDTLALALGLYTEVTVEDAPSLAVTSEGEGSEHARDGTHLAVQVAVRVRGHDRLRVHVRSDIPVGRGLGSSAALAVAAAAAAGAEDPLQLGSEVDGHAENAAASALGGLVTAAMVDGRAVAHHLALDPALAYVVVIPDRILPTKEARAALPAAVPHADASFNLGRLGLLIAGLADHRVLSPSAFEDRLHQPQRGALFPEAEILLEGLRAAGALGSCWSGAGPTLLAVCQAATAERVRAAATDLLSAHDVAGHARILPADMQGLLIDGAPAGLRPSR